MDPLGGLEKGWKFSGMVSAKLPSDSKLPWIALLDTQGQITCDMEIFHQLEIELTRALLPIFHGVPILEIGKRIVADVYAIAPRSLQTQLRKCKEEQLRGTSPCRDCIMGSLPGCQTAGPASLLTTQNGL